MAENAKESEITAITEINGKTDVENQDYIIETVSKNSSNASDYDSAGSYSDAENKPQRPRNSDQNEQASCSESEGSVTFEREEGDGQESIPAKKVDDDEDKKNPQYIPKRGTFYEHDDRCADDGETPEGTDPDKTDKDSKKKVWQDKKERWNHDRFNDDEQAPKSRTELIAIYGYDIRNEDGPPRARRRRRYGRGPNKYTRNWEDEDAYGKPTVIRKVNKKRRSKDETDSQTDQTENIEEEEFINQEDSERVVSSTTAEENLEPPPNKPKENVVKSNSTVYNTEHQNNNKNQQRAGSGRVAKPKREIKDSDYKGFTKSRLYKSSKAEPSTARVQRDAQPQTQFKNQSVQEVEKDMAKMNIQEGNYKNNKHNNQRQGSVPPRLQGEQKGSKRYSSIRQRSLPETANPPFNQHGTYYGNGAVNNYNQQNQQPQQIQSNSIPQIPPANLPPIPPQAPVTTAPLLQAPPQFAPPFPQPPAFLQPGVAPPPFIAQQPAPIINYVPSQPQFPQAPYQGFQQQFTPVNPPPDLFQPQGGITYYSTQEQQAAQRSAIPKRPKAAIPIVAPPEHRGRGRSTNQIEIAPNANDFMTEAINESAERFEDAALTIAQ